MTFHRLKGSLIVTQKSSIAIRQRTSGLQARAANLSGNNLCNGSLPLSVCLLTAAHHYRRLGPSALFQTSLRDIALQLSPS